MGAAIDAWFDAYNDGDKTMEVSENLVKALEITELTGETADRKADILKQQGASVQEIHVDVRRRRLGL